MIFPGVTMALALFSLNFIGDGIRDALDPQTRKF
jgi:oligopeptide transport system permease protein